MAASLPKTCIATWVTISHMTGLTLPGMIDDPACSSGRCSSPRPVAGPDPMSLMSLAILISATAKLRRWAEASTNPSRAAWAANRLGAMLRSTPKRAASRETTSAPNAGSAFNPLPTAVPPRGTLPTRASALWSRSMASATWAAYPSNSSERNTGTASIMWVRPALTTPWKRDAASCSERARPAMAGSKRRSSSTTAASVTAVGNVSFDDCPALT